MAQTKRVPLADHDKLPTTERIASSIKRLTQLSSELKVETDEVGKSLAQFEKPLLKLALVPTWHKVAAGEDQHGNYWTREVGYTTIKGVWCIALRRTWGNEFADDFNEEVWRFTQAPHWQQIEALGKMAGLYEELITRTDETIKKLRAKRQEADQVAAALNAALEEIGK
ncbi:MAG TPA: hypothetical protein VKM54_25770 [Myxococcota bacterium]|nr:hypothetical protein [Myxococcota bacterium]